MEEAIQEKSIQTEEEPRQMLYEIQLQRADRQGEASKVD